MFHFFVMDIFFSFRNGFHWRLVVARSFNEGEIYSLSKLRPVADKL